MPRLARLALAAALAFGPVPGRAAFTPAPVPQGAFLPYVPTVSAASGTLVSASATGRYQVTGKRVDIEITITVTTNGTGATALQATLPSGLPMSSAAVYVVNGRNNSSGKAVHAYAVANTNLLSLTNYDNGYPGADSQTIFFSGFYETN